VTAMPRVPITLLHCKRLMPWLAALAPAPNLSRTCEVQVIEPHAAHGSACKGACQQSCDRPHKPHTITYQETSFLQEPNAGCLNQSKPKGYHNELDPAAHGLHQAAPCWPQSISPDLTHVQQGGKAWIHAVSRMG